MCSLSYTNDIEFIGDPMSNIKRVGEKVSIDQILLLVRYTTKAKDLNLHVNPSTTKFMNV